MAENQVIKARVDMETKAAFQAAAARQGTSEARLLHLLVSTFLRSNALDADPVAATELKNERFSFRLHAKLKQDLSKRAVKQGMSPSSYLVGMIRAHLSQKSYFTEPELVALKDSNYQLSRIGSNINQIARALNTSLDNAHMARAKEIEQIRPHVMECRELVRALILANVAGWGIERKPEKL